ncbi:MAG: hypothetical protein Q7V05_00400 [Methanoregula sp.]|nr:hypothetical protein [Methanoregula sp.]
MKVYRCGGIELLQQFPVRFVIFSLLQASVYIRNYYDMEMHQIRLQPFASP